MKKFISCLVAFTLTMSFVACGNKENSKEKDSKKEITTENNTIENEEEKNNNDYIDAESNYDEEVAQSDVSKNIIYDTFSDIKYLEDDDKFILSTENGDTYAVNKSGAASYLSDVMLKSKMITKIINGTNNYSLYDISGNDISDKFITDSDNESILDAIDTDNGYIVWTIKEEETPTSSKCILTAFDYDGNVLYSADDEDYDFVKECSDSLYPIYLGENVFGFVSRDGYEHQHVCCINLETDEYFEFTMEDGDRFSKGYIVDPNKNSIIDTHGNTVFDDNNELSGDIFNVGEGMFINFYDSKFYNMNDLSLAIDLSEYSFVATATGFGNIDWENTQDGAFEFIDGYCGLRMKNENDTYFFGLIDKFGKWVMEPIEVDGFTSGSYNGKITDNLLNVNDSIFNISTKEITENPVNAKLMTKPTIIDGVAYFIDDNGYFCSYDYETDERKQIEVYL